MRNAVHERRSMVFLFLILAIILSVILIIALSLRTDPVAENMEKDTVIKTLIVVNDGEGKALFTDVFAYYPSSTKGALFNIEGNVGAIFESLNRVDRIDRVYSELGIKAYCKEISWLTAMDIPFTMEITLDDFGCLTDILGGLKLFIPTPVDYKDSSGKSFLLPSGAVTLDGDKVKTYVDLALPFEQKDAVVERRQNILVAFLSALKENRDIIMDKENFAFFESRVNKNIDHDAFYVLMSQISNVDTERLSPRSVDGSLRNVDGQTLLFPHYDGQLIKDVVKQTLSSLVSENSSLASQIRVLEIQNGTTVQGAARRAAILLQGLGYDVLQTSNADNNDYEHTVIINHIGDKEAVDALADFIHCKYIKDEEVLPVESGLATAADVDFTIILGKDWDGRYVKGGYTGNEN